LSKLYKSKVLSLSEIGLLKLFKISDIFDHLCQLLGSYGGDRPTNSSLSNVLLPFMVKDSKFSILSFLFFISDLVSIFDTNLSALMGESIRCRRSSETYMGFSI